MARKRYPLAATDRNGSIIRTGDYVRLVQVPRLTTMPPETKSVFRRARGRSFRIAGFERNGLAELYVGRYETIYVEPEHLCLLRRGRRPTAQRESRGHSAL